MLTKYGMVDCKPISMPLDVNTKLSTHDGDVLEDLTMYRRIVGSLIYLTITWLDLSYTMGLQSQFMQLPWKLHLDAVHRTLRYVRATLDHALFYALQMFQWNCMVTQMQIGLVAPLIDGLLAGLCLHLGVLLSLGATRSSPQLPCLVQRLSIEVLQLYHVR